MINKCIKTAAIPALFCLILLSLFSAVYAEDADNLHIITTIFPEYDWVRNILGSNPAGANTTLLLDSGVDLHSYQPTAEDILNISTCDLFIYVGGESDEWVEDALEEAVNQNMLVINLLETLGDSVKEEEFVEGMQAEDHDHGHDDEEEHEHEHDHDEEEAHHDEGEDEHHHDEEGPEYDEHVWLSLRNASVLCKKIAETIAVLDPDNAGLYQKNAEAYIQKLTDLDVEYQKAVSEAPVRTLLFGDRFPFRYLTDDYGLDYYAAFVGCSAETEASFETIVFLTEKVNELGLHAVITIEGRDHRIAQTIVQNTGTKDQQILTMDSMQSVTSRDVQNGASYLSIMESNLEVLKKALK